MDSDRSWQQRKDEFAQRDPAEKMDRILTEAVLNIPESESTVIKTEGDRQARRMYRVQALEIKRKGGMVDYGIGKESDG